MKNFQETVFGDKNVNLLAAEPHITSLPLPAANYDAIMRQLKSTSRDLRRMFTADLTVLQIAERFSTIDANASTSEAIDLMHQRDFDVYGVRQGERVIGFVTKDAPDNGTCETAASAFQLEDIVSDSTPLLDAIRMLHDKDRLFILNKNNVDHIVTRADMQKFPVRMLLFSLVTLLEMQMLRLTRQYHPEDRWIQLLSPDRVEKAQKLQLERRDRNEDMDLADCLQFGDKRDILLKTTAWMASVRIVGSKRRAKSLLDRLQSLRDTVAHGQDLLAGRTWPDIVDLTYKAEQLLEEFEQEQPAQPAHVLASSVTTTAPDHR